MYIYLLSSLVTFLPSYPLPQGSNGDWWVQCVPKTLGSPVHRVKLPVDWCGLRGDALTEVCGVPDSLLVHPLGFIASNRTYDGVLQMAKLTLA